MILNEEYRTLLLNENIIKDTLKDLKVNTGILFTFGTGMGALLPPVDRLLSGSGFQFNQQEISLLIITSIAILLNDTNKDKLLSTIKIKKPRIFILGYFEIDFTFIYVEVAHAPILPRRLSFVWTGADTWKESMFLSFVYRYLFISFLLNVKGF